MAETKRRDIDSLRQFLLSRGWHVSRSREKFERYSPPASLNVGNQFYITLPTGSVTAGTQDRYFNEVSTILAQLYGWSPDNLERAVEPSSTVFSIRFSGDDDTARGTIPLVDFEAFLSRLKDLIRDIADFATSNLPFTGEALEVADSFVRECQFLQTERGSFVSRIELPTSVTLRPGDMLQSAISGKDAADRLADVLTFVSDRVLKGDETIYDDETFVNSSEVLNVNVLEDVETLVEHIGDRAVTFHFARPDMEKQVATGRVSAPELARLSDYVRFVREKLSQTVPIDLVGAVVQLRSRDPEGNRNLVTVQAADRAFLPLVVALDSARYQIAVDAHVHKRPVRIRGNAVKLKTQLKMLRLDDFGLLGGRNT